MTGLTTLAIEYDDGKISSCIVGTWFTLDIAMMSKTKLKKVIIDTKIKWNKDDKKCPKTLFNNRLAYLAHYTGEADFIFLIPKDRECFIDLRKINSKL